MGLSIATLSSLFLINVLNRLFIPWFSRLQDDLEALRKTFIKVLRWANRLTAPLISGMVVFAQPLILFVFSEKWMPAHLTLVMICIANIFIPTSNICLSFLNAMGHSKTTFKIMMLATAASWFMAAILIYVIGLNGYGASTIIINFIHVILFFKVKKILNVNILMNVLPFWLISYGCALVILVLNYFMSMNSLRIFVLYLVLYGLMICALNLLIFKSEIKGDFLFYKQNLPQ